MNEMRNDAGLSARGRVLFYADVSQRLRPVQQCHPTPREFRL